MFIYCRSRLSGIPPWRKSSNAFIKGMYYIYVIKSLMDGRFYIGQTNNFEKRLIRHNKGVVKSTRGRGPFSLIFQEKFKSRKEAINRERYLKSLKGGNEFKRILNKHCRVV